MSNIIRQIKGHYILRDISNDKIVKIVTYFESIFTELNLKSSILHKNPYYHVVITNTDATLSIRATARDNIKKELNINSDEIDDVLKYYFTLNTKIECNNSKTFLYDYTGSLSTGAR